MDADALVDLRSLLLARSVDDVLLLTSQGRARLLSVPAIPLVSDNVVWRPDEREDQGTDEWLAAATTTASAPRFWTIVTRRGYCCQYIRIALEQAVAREDQILNSPLDRDAASVVVSGDTDDLLVVSRWGAGLRFPQRAIASSGSLAMELEPDDEIAAALPIESELEILIVTASGYAVRRDSSSLKMMTRPGGTGKPLIRAFDVLGLFPYVRDAQLLFLTQSGRLVRAPVTDLPLTARYGKGQVVCDLSRDPAVGVVCIPAAAWPAD
jgi:DNA gyrase/topoisomerase IV subunit A